MGIVLPDSVPESELLGAMAEVLNRIMYKARGSEGCGSKSLSRAASTNRLRIDAGTRTLVSHTALIM